VREGVSSRERERVRERGNEFERVRERGSELKDQRDCS
jgi:hypothetical protein